MPEEKSEFLTIAEMAIPQEDIDSLQQLCRDCLIGMNKALQPKSIKAAGQDATTEKIMDLIREAVMNAYAIGALQAMQGHISQTIQTIKEETNEQRANG